MTPADHILILDGWPHRWAILPRPRAMPSWRPEGPGRALCSCDWLSHPLPTTEARRQAHAHHVTEDTP